MRVERRTLLAGGVAALAMDLNLAACAPKSGDAKTAGGAKVVRFATDWRAEAEHGGFYQALATGEYKKRGLDVAIIPGGPGSSVPSLLAAGQVDFGIGSNSFGVLNLAASKVPARAVMATMQKDPQVLMSHPEAAISGLGDMKGHPILIGDEAVTTFWRWLKAKYGFTDDMVRKYSFNPGPFIADKAAVQEGYVSSEPYTVEKEGKFKPKVFLLADNGYPGYAGMVLAADAMIAKDPAAVKAFVDGSKAGWNAYLHGDPRPADALILKDNPDMRQDLLDYARKAFRDHAIFETGKTPLGSMDDAHWAEFFEVASGLGIYPKTLDYKSAYSLAFL